METRGSKAVPNVRQELVPSDQRLSKGFGRDVAREAVNAFGPNRVKYSASMKRGPLGGKRHVTTATVRGKKVGEIVIKQPRKPGKPGWVSSLHTNAEHRGRGIGQGLGRRGLQANRKLTLRTHAFPFDQGKNGPNQKTLMRHYEEAGFKRKRMLRSVVMGSGYMERKPRGPIRGLIGKAESYPGSHLSPGEKRARVIAAGATPFIGPLAAGAQAAKLAPKEQRRSAAITQTGSIWAGAGAGAVGGAFTAAKSPKVDRQLQRGATKINAVRNQLADRAPRRVQRLVRPATGPSRVGRAALRAVERTGRFGRPIAANPRAAGLGALGGKAVGTAVGGALGYTAVLHREHERNARLSRVGKAQVAGAGLTQREQREQYRRRRHALGLSIAATGLGAAGAGTLAAREIGPHLPRVGPRLAPHTSKLERAGLATALLGGAVGSAQGVTSARIQRRDLAAQRVGKAFRAPSFRASNIAVRRTRSGSLVPVRRANGVSKINTTISREDADKVKAQYGIRGPLPKTLSREQRIHAYEGRYVAAGGPKGEKWQRRSDNLDHVTGAALGTGGVAAGAQLHLEHRARRLATAGAPAKAAERSAARSGKIGLAAAGIGAISELGHRHAQHRASSYRSSPAGVAAGALRRLRDYTPD